MASPGLPEDITAGVTTGHVTDHEKIHDLLNEFDSAAQAQATGDLLVFQDGLIKRLPVGSDGQVLTADSGETAGVKWAGADGAVARWERSVNQTIPDSTTTVVIWDSAVFENDPNNDFTMNTSTGVLTINNAGIYQISFGCDWDFNSVGDRQLFLTINAGASLAAARQAASSNSTQNVLTIYEFAANDTLEARVNQTSGGNLAVRANPRTNLVISRLRSASA